MEDKKDGKDKAVLILTEDKYGIILMDSRNWVVAERKKVPVNQVDVGTKDFDDNSYTFHQNIRQAIIEMADRMVKDRIRRACANKPIELRELVTIIKEKDQWMRRAIMWREEL